MPKTPNEHLVFVDDLEVWVRLKRIRSVRLHVKSPTGRIEVSAPVDTSDCEVAQLVRRKRAWIAKAQKRIASSPMAHADEADEEEQREWRAIVQALAEPLVHAWEPVLGVKAGTLAYRNMKSRWGSCQPSTGRICLNIRLALYPRECLEYVVVHELCHLLVRGHGPEFYRLMTSVMPDWKQRRAKLR